MLLFFLLHLFSYFTRRYISHLYHLVVLLLGLLLVVLLRSYRPLVMCCNQFLDLVSSSSSSASLNTPTPEPQSSPILKRKRKAEEIFDSDADDVDSDASDEEAAPTISTRPTHPLAR